MATATTLSTPTETQTLWPATRPTTATATTYTTPVAPARAVTSRARLSTQLRFHNRYRRMPANSTTGTTANTAGKALCNGSLIRTPAWSPSPATARAVSQAIPVRAAGTRAAASSRAARISPAVAVGSVPRSTWVARPTSETSTPKKATKKRGWSMKLLRHEMSAMTAVTAPARTAVARGVSPSRRGRVPSGNNSTAHR